MATGFHSLLAPWIGGAATGYPAAGVGALVIAGVDRTEWLAENTGRFRRQFNQRSGFSGELDDRERGYIPLVGSSLLVFNGSTRLFGGFITSTKAHRKPSNAGRDHILWSIEATDHNLIADRRLLYHPGTLGVISYGPGFAGDIMKAIVGLGLSGESIDVSLVETGPFLAAPVTFFFETVTAAFNKICQLTGWRWRIDEYRRLRFSAFDVDVAPFEITEVSENWRDLFITRDTKNYRNHQFARTETNLEKEKTETFTGDGTTRDFFIGFVDPVSANPTRFFTGTAPVITLDGSPLTVGRFGYDDAASFGVMYDAPLGPSSLGGVGIHFVSPQSAPGVGVIISVTYNYGNANVVEDLNAAEIAARQAIEGGSGIWQNVDEQRNIGSFDTLEEIAAGDLGFYSLIPFRAEYETDSQGLEPGQLQNFDLAFHGMVATLLVESIETRWLTGTRIAFRHSVVCTDLGPMAGPERILEKLAEVARIGVPRAAGALTGVAADGGGQPVPEDIGGRVSDGNNANFLEASSQTNDSLTASGGPFTVALWIRADDLGQTGKVCFVFRALFDSPRWGIDFVSGAARFFAVGYTGTDPAAGAGVAIPDGDWHHVAWRKATVGASAWEMFLDGVKFIIDPARDFTLGSITFYARAFRMGSGSGFQGALAQIAVWDVAVPDAAIAQIAAQQRPDDVYPTGLIQYWAIDGTSSPEPNGATSGISAKPTLLVNGSLPPA